MTSRIQEHRYATTATKPGNGTRPPGELWLNFPDYRLGMIDATQVAVDLVAVRNYAATSTYALGDYVVNAGQLLRAKAALTPHAFSAGEWDSFPTQAQTDALYTTQAQNDARYYTKAQSDANYYSRIYIDGTYYTKVQSDARYYTQAQSDARYLPLTGGTLSGNLTIAGRITFANLGINAHGMEFGWDGTEVLAWVDSVYVGALATRAWVTATEANYLPIGGGTVTGNLQVNGTLVSLGTFQTNSARAIVYHPTVSPSLTLYQGSLNAAMGFWFDGDLNFGGMGGTGIPAIYSGRITRGGNVEAANYVIGDNGVFARGDITFGLYQQPSYRVLQFTSNWAFLWEIATGTLSWLTPSGVHFSIDGSGNVNANTLTASFVHATLDVNADRNVTAHTDVEATTGDLRAGNNARITNTMSCVGGDMYMAAGGGGRILQMASGWYWEWDSSNGDITWKSPGVSDFVQARSSDGIWVDYHGPCAGIGAYVNFSDARAKRDITPAIHGLTEILQLNPVIFRRTDHDSIELGFIAQDVQLVIPEAVRPLGVPLPDGGGELDSESPSLGISIDPIVAALVNATKELAQRLALLEANS